MRTVTENLLTYALGRELAADDMPAVRAIMRRAAAGQYRLPDLIDRHHHQHAVHDADEGGRTGRDTGCGAARPERGEQSRSAVMFITKKGVFRAAPSCAASA